MKEVLKEIVSTVLYLLAVVCVVFLLIKYVGQRTIVDGESMVPTLHHQDNLIVDKISYRFQDPERFDIIVFPFAYAENVYYIKRIIGLPGETVQIDEDGRIYINGEVLEESYGAEVIRPEYIGIAAEEILLGEDEYFVLGDHRSVSADSRKANVGVVKKSELDGVVILRVYPFSKFGKVD